MDISPLFRGDEKKRREKKGGRKKALRNEWKGRCMKKNMNPHV